MRYLHDLLPNLDHRFAFGMAENTTPMSHNHLQIANVREQSQVLQESEIAAAFERGRQDAAAKLQAQHEAQLEALRIAQQLKFDEMMTDLEITKAKEFSSLLEITLRELEQKMDGLLFALVNPFIQKMVPAVAIKELEVLAKGALSENITYKLDVSGPQVLLEGIKERLSSLKIEVVTEATDTFEVQVRCDEFLLTTRMEEWLKKINGKIER